MHGYPYFRKPPHCPCTWRCRNCSCRCRSGDFQYVWRTGSIRLATNPCGSSRKDPPNAQWLSFPFPKMPKGQRMRSRKPSLPPEVQRGWAKPTASFRILIEPNPTRTVAVRLSGYWWPVRRTAPRFHPQYSLFHSIPQHPTASYGTSDFEGSLWELINGRSEPKWKCHWRFAHLQSMLLVPTRGCIGKLCCSGNHARNAWSKQVQLPNCFKHLRFGI